MSAEIVGYDNMILRESAILFIFVLVVTLFLLISRRKIMSALAGVFVFFLLYFYRTPIYKMPEVDEKNIYSPCYGKVLSVEYYNDHNVVIVFLSPFDIHTQFMPCSGKIADKTYHPGEFNPAYILQKTKYNECMKTVIQSKHGIIVVDQVAGQLVRRIVNNLEVGSDYPAGYMIGMIKFGSMVRIYLPKKIKILVNPGDKVRGMETIIGTTVSADDNSGN